MSLHESAHDLVQRIKILVPYLNGKYKDFGPKRMQDDRYLILLYGATMIDEFSRFGTKQGRLLYFPYNQLNKISKSPLLSPPEPIDFESTRTARKRAYPSLKTQKMVRIERIDVPGYKSAECVAITKRGVNHARMRIIEIGNGLSKEIPEIQLPPAYHENRSPDEKSNDVNAWVKKGDANAGWGRFIEAIGCYDIALRIDPNHAVALGRKGNCLLNLENIDKALLCLYRALEIDPNLAWVLDNIAWAFGGLAGRTGNSDESLRYYGECLQYAKRASRLDPSLPEPWYRIGWTLQKLGKIDEAQKYIDKARKLGFEG